MLCQILTVLALFQGSLASTSYSPYRFEPSEGWTASGSGDAGATKLEGKTWSLDFSKGARWLSVAPPDRVLLGNVNRLRIRVRGSAKGHPVHLYLNTHFMTFHKVAGQFTGSGEQELAIDAPPGPGWQWFEGENDGKLHGPLRLGEIRLEANGVGDRLTLELMSIAVEGSVPDDKRCVLTASAGDDQPEFRAETRCLGGAGLGGVLSWTFRDWEGNQIGTGQEKVTVPSTAEKLSVRAPSPVSAPGIKFVEASFQLAIPGQEIAPVRTCWVSPPEPHTDVAPRPESPFGMGIYLGRYRGEDMERTAGKAREAGVKWSREDFEWSTIERRPGEFDWTFHDNLVDVALRNGISVYAIVAYWPEWTKAYTEEGVEQYAEFMRRLVRRYKDRIHQWEIWNEPNIFFWQGPKELYARLLIRSYAAIKEEDPKAEVLGISTAGIDYNFIARMLAMETPFDILTIHPYRKVLDDRLFMNELKIVSDLVKRRPVWLTEMGWSTYTPHNTLGQDFSPVTERAQAELLARTYLCSILSGVEPRTFWYDFRNDGEDPLYFENEMGILHRDFRPKPAYAAFSTLARVLKGKKPAGALDLGPGIFAWRFEPGNVIAVWNPAAGGTVRIPVAATAVTLVNTIGETRTLQAQGGHVEIGLRPGAPVYLLLP